MSVPELVVLSGKGGTGKTSLLGSFAILARQAILADCDVDAADLHLLLSPTVQTRVPFWSGNEAIIDPERCTGCGVCETLCRFQAISRVPPHDGRPPGAVVARRVDPIACEGCGVCVDHCEARAIEFPERLSGELFVSDTRCGPMVHARLGVAAENSGKLVSAVREEARRIAQSGDSPLILVDGPPGIGCPVIASVTGAAAVLAVTEPSLSGEHDLLRLMDLCRHFSVPVAVCVNKWDVNPDASERIEALARERGAKPVGRVPYDRAVTAAQLEARTAVEVGGEAAEAIRRVWERWLAAAGLHG